MTAQITVIPSGHEFFVEGADTILEAGLRGGLALDYGCSNGNCGRCRVRIASGETRQVRHHDYALTESEKRMGYILSCSHTPVSDVVIEAEEAEGAHDIPMQSIAVRFKKIDQSDKHTAIVSLKTSRTNRLRFLSGQSVTLSIDGIGARSYPIASCPCDDMNLQFHLPLANDDPIAKYFVETARPNDAVTVEGPSGLFSLNENSPNSLVFIAQDEGFAPIKALIEHAMALDTAEKILLIRVASQDRAHYLNNLCRAWNDALDNFEYVTPNQNWVDPDRLTDYLATALQDRGKFQQLDYYVCGSRPFVDAVALQLSELQVPESQQAALILDTGSAGV